MSIQVVLDVPDDIYEQVEKLAVTTERDIADVLLETIARTLSPFPVDPNRSVMNQNVETYRELHAELVMTHLGQYVAICEGKLVDFDADPVTLLQRVRTLYNAYVHYILTKWYFAERSKLFLNVNFSFDIHEQRSEQSSYPCLTQIPRLDIGGSFPSD